MTIERGPLSWFRDFGRPPRILGLDVARGLAILGMAGAHIGDTVSFEWTDPATWTDLVNGRSSILFAVLAGVSIALMTGRHVLPDPALLPGIRLRLVGRGAAIFVIGILLELLNTPVAVILTLYGLLYIAVIPFLRWKPWQLLVGAGALALVGPALLALITHVTMQPRGGGIDFVLYGSYPITVWMAFVLGGLALGRWGVDSVPNALTALGVGIVLAVVGYGLGGFGAVPLYGVDGALGALDAMRLAFFAAYPHSGGTAEILGSGGFVLALIALCVLLSRPLRWPLLPFAALGSMPLTAYSAHLIVIAVMGAGVVGYSAGEYWTYMSLGLLVAATLYAMLFGRGPLERLVGRAATAMAGAAGAAPVSASGHRVGS